MLDVFFGGLLFHPAAMDYSDETCSHGCAYCFANINKAYREGDLQGAIRRLYRQDDTTLIGRLVREGYPICVSNRTDGFAKNNERNTRALFTHLAERENGIFIQTKGGDCIGEIIESLPKKPVIYISITMLDDTLAKTVEQNAPRSIHATSPGCRPTTSPNCIAASLPPVCATSSSKCST